MRAKTQQTDDEARIAGPIAIAAVVPHDMPKSEIPQKEKYIRGR